MKRIIDFLIGELFQRAMHNNQSGIKKIKFLLNRYCYNSSNIKCLVTTQTFNVS